MDFATLLGIICGFGLVIWAILLGGDLGIFFDIPSVMIVVGGTLAAICVTFPFEEVIQAFAAGFKVFGTRRVHAPDVVQTMVRVAEISRREGAHRPGRTSRRRTPF